jgi:hypothetical protein
MAIENRTDLIKEIEAFSKALYDYSEIGDEIIAISKFHPYYSEQGILKRNDYSGEILDEEAFLVFYCLFFDMIELNLNAEKVSDSQYFNTLYQTYRDEKKRTIADLDLFMQVIKTKKEKETAARNKHNKEEYNAVEGFLDLVLRRKIRKNIKSKTSKDKSLTQIIKKEDNNKDYRTISFVVASLLSILTTFLVMLSGFNPVTAAFIIIIILILFAYTISCFTVNKLNKSEKEELKQLPKDFKKYILGGYTTFNEEFFSHQISSYIDSFFKDSVVYPYVKAKYTKIENGNSITNE